MQNIVKISSILADYSAGRKCVRIIAQYRKKKSLSICSLNYFIILFKVYEQKLNWNFACLKMWWKWMLWTQSERLVGWHLVKMKSIQVRKMSAKTRERRIKAWKHKSTTLLWILKEPISKNCLHMQALIMLLHETMQNYNETNRKQTNKYIYIYIYTHKSIVYCICIHIFL